MPRPVAAGMRDLREAHVEEEVPGELREPVANDLLRGGECRRLLEHRQFALER